MKNNNAGEVRLPKGFVAVGLVCGALFMSFAIFAVFAKAYFAVAVFLPLTLAAAALIVACVNCRITYDATGFVHKSFFGVERSYFYHQITAIREMPNETYLYMGDHRAMVDRYAVGGEVFLAYAKARYADHYGVTIPQKGREKGGKLDVFNGHVKGGTGLLVLYVVLAVLFAGFFAMIVYTTYFIPVTEADTTPRRVAFISCGEYDGDLILRTNEDFADKEWHYEIQSVDSTVDVEAIRALCDGETYVDVFVQEKDPNSNSPYYVIRALRHNGEDVLSFEVTEAIEQRENSLAVVLMGGFFVFWILVIVFSIKVGRNPGKYSKKVVRLFFKDGYIIE